MAAVCAWHAHHEAAVGEIGRRLRNDEPMLVAAPALIESYAVLTRLPPPHRLAARDAHRLVETNFVEGGKIVTLEARTYRTLLRWLAEAGVTGGRVYDAVIAECALRERGTALLTFNAADFMPFVARGLEVVVPGADGE